MDGKGFLLLIAVVAVGMFVLPSSLALYTGSHDFYGAEEVDCGKCHSSAAGDQIGASIQNGSAHLSLTCKDCHYGVAGVVGGRFAVDVVGNDSGQPGSSVTAHAAGITVNCIDCHSYNDLYAVSTKDADGLIYSVNVSYELGLPGEAHRMLTVNTTADNGGLNDNDAVCIACHSRAVVDVRFSSLGTHNASTGTIYITNGTTVTNWMYDDIQ